MEATLTTGGRAQPDSTAASEATPSQRITPMYRIALFTAIQNAPRPTAKVRNAQNVKLIAPRKAKARHSDRDILEKLLARRRVALHRRHGEGVRVHCDRELRVAQQVHHDAYGNAKGEHETCDDGQLINMSGLNGTTKLPVRSRSIVAALYACDSASSTALVPGRRSQSRSSGCTRLTGGGGESSDPWWSIVPTQSFRRLPSESWASSAIVLLERPRRARNLTGPEANWRQRSRESPDKRSDLPPRD